ncbi:MAG: TetR/AcrR family transcriptional regulator [Eubacteriaceae bacterium]
MDIQYSDKEIAILDGMLSLIKNGENLHEITVSEIAKSAGVGKGTIYEYFKSKEEVFSKAILFSLSNEVLQFVRRINEKKGFKARYYEVLKIIEENMENVFSSFHIFLSFGTFYQVRKYIFEDSSDLDKYSNPLEKEMDNLLISGYEDEIIQKVQDDYYRRMVLKSSFCAFADYLTMKRYFNQVSIEVAKDYSYKMLIKSLNE